MFLSMFSMISLLGKAETSSWVTKASLPQPVDLMGAATAYNKIYVIGGWGGSDYLDTNYEYNPTDDAWTLRASMPSKRNTLAVVSANNRIYAIGGAISVSGGTLSTNEEYDPASNTWSVKSSMPSSRNWISAGTVNDKIYVIGGSDNYGGVNSNNEAYDPLSDTWSTKAPMPTARWGTGAGVVNGKIYVLGGCGIGGANLNVNEEYNPVTDTWTTRAPMPTGRNALAVVAVNNKIYAIGGATDANPWTNNLNIVEEYDPSTDTWNTVESMLTSRSCLAAATVGERIYAIGGWDGSNFLGTNEEFSSGLVGYWKFDEGSGSVAGDSSGNENTGTIYGAEWITGVIGTAVNLNGVDNYVAVPTSPTIAVSGTEVSLECWIKAATTIDDSNAQPTSIIDKGDEYGFQMNPSDGRIWFVVVLEPGPQTNWQGITTTRNSWIAGTWYHLAGTYDGSSLRIYVNEELQNSRSCSGNLLSPTPFPLAIGAHSLGYDNCFNGAIDEVKIYDYARTAEEIRADASLVRAWKDSASLGLENDHLLLHGLAATGNYRWFFDYLVFKDTGTKWYQPWGELAMLVYPNFQWNGVSTTNFEVNAFTEADKAYLQYSITSGNLKEELTYTIYPGQPYVYVTLSVTNIGSVVENTHAGVQFTTWIAGDYANDYYYVPGYAQGEFTGSSGYIHFTGATDNWAAEWDQNKEEGCGILSTKGFTPSNIVSEDFGNGEGFELISNNFSLAPGQSSATYDCYYYFFTGTGWQKTKSFYESARALEVPYQNQGDANWCGPTSLAMVLRYYGKTFHSWNFSADRKLAGNKGIGDLNDLATYVSQHYPELLTESRSYGILTKTLIFDDVKTDLSNGYPVILALGKPPTPVISQEGHVVVVVGMNETGFFVNDPSGYLFTDLAKITPSPWPYIHAYIDWSKVEPFIVTWPFTSTLTVKGSQNPKLGTLYFEGEDIQFLSLTLLTEHYFLDLDKGLIWKHVKANGAPTADNTIPPAFDHIYWTLEISNGKRESQSFVAGAKILCPDGQEQPLPDLTVNNLAGLSQTSVLWNWADPGIPTLNDILNLHGNGMYFITFTLKNSNGAITDSYTTAGFFLGSNTKVKTHEHQKHLYLHIYDYAGNHVGLDYTTNQTELGIPGSYYYDDENGTIVIVVPQIINLTITVDARYAEDPIESYNLTLTLNSDFGNYSQIYSRDITLGEKQAFSVRTVGTYILTIAGDVNGDGIVNIRDVTPISLNWQKTVPPAPANADVNGDGIVNIRDVTFIALNWQEHV